MASIQDLEQRKFGSQDANGNVPIKVLTVSNTDQIAKVTQESILPDYVYDKCVRTQNGAGITPFQSGISVCAAGGGQIRIFREDTSVINGEELGSFAFQATQGSGLVGASVRGEATQTWVNGSASGGKLILRTTTNNSVTPTDKFVIEQDGRVYGTALHNTGTITGTTNQYIASGTYTPTLTNVTNISASTAYSCQYMRVGNVVNVSGRVDIDATAAAATELGMSLPVASDFAANEKCAGTGASLTALDDAIVIRADATNNRAQFVFTATDVANTSRFFQFQYVIL